ncbi:hypothetical protein ACFQVC_13075 [Streptomyces monticola]|uniref:ESX-1 secretion-associated protein n=1 Tax=Streptomyces monticola TaxID=2666263 RepID=A0ABW2JHY0_9ACTN
MADQGRGNGEDLAVSSVDLQGFKKRIDVLLEHLEKGNAHPAKIGEQTITAASYGTGFAAADDLSKAYEKVRSRLERLSRLFGEQIEAMGLAVSFADKGYDGTDVEQAQRYTEIRARAEKYYDDPAAQSASDSGAAAPGTGEGTGGATSGGFS